MGTRTVLSLLEDTFNIQKRLLPAGGQREENARTAVAIQTDIGSIRQGEEQLAASSISTGHQADRHQYTFN